MNRLYASGGQSIGVSASASVCPMNIQDWFSLGLTGWSPCSPRDSQESSPTPQFKSINYLAFSFLYSPTLTSIHGGHLRRSYSQQVQVRCHCFSRTFLTHVFELPLPTCHVFPWYLQLESKLYCLPGPGVISPSGPAVKTLCFQCRKHQFDPQSGN